MQKKDRRNTGGILPFSCWDCMRYFVIPALFVAAVAIILALFATDYINGDNMLYAALDRLIHNVTVQFGLLHEKTFSLMNKDMVLMDNVTSLDDRIDLLSINSSDQIAALMAKDMILMGNVSSLDARIIQEESARIAKDMILMGNISSLDLRVSTLESDVSTIESTIMSLELKDMGLMNNQTLLQAEIQNLYTDSMMQQAQLNALVSVGQILNQTDVNITVKLGELMMDAIALEMQVEITYNKSSANMMAIAQNTMDINTLDMTTFKSLAVQSPGTGSYSALSSSNVVKVTPGSGISMAVDGTPSLVVSTDYPTLVPTISNPTYAPTIANAICGAPTCSSSAGITSIVAPGGSATGPAVTFTGSTGIAVSRVLNFVTFENTMSISADSGGSTADGADVLISGGTGISTSRSGNTITATSTVTGGPISGNGPISGIATSGDLLLDVKPRTIGAQSVYWCRAGVPNNCITNTPNPLLPCSATISISRLGNYLSIVNVNPTALCYVTNTAPCGGPSGQFQTFYLCDGTAPWNPAGACTPGVGCLPLSISLPQGPSFVPYSAISYWDSGNNRISLSISIRTDGVIEAGILPGTSFMEVDKTLAFGGAGFVYPHSL